jgi:hypothetical protein
MNKIGIFKIGFKEQNEVNDQWVQQEQQEERSIPDVYIDGSHWFKSIDQTATELTEDITVDETGVHYEVQLPFTVRLEVDTELAKKYAGRPVVVYAVAVDGKQYTIGTKSYPTYLVISNRYDAMNTREVAVNVKYQSKTSLLR